MIPALMFTIAVHGGAGLLSREGLGPERTREIRAGLAAAVEAEAAIKALELSETRETLAEEKDAEKKEAA